MNISRLSRVAVIAAIIAMVSCMQEPQAPENAVVDAKSQSTDSVEWFDGSVSEAFATAKTEGKPIYLYWGAEWCPPCHAIKSTVFRSAEFVARSKLFVAVYLDGDKENAQAAGEKFGVRGYPTMIVFDPDGVELTRIPGGIDIQAYANILDLTLDKVSPVSDLVESLASDRKTLSEEECRLLAYYSWNQNLQLLENRDKVTLFRSIYDACPAKLQPERSLAYMRYLDELIDSLDTEIAESALSSEQVADATKVVYSILGDPDLVRANVFPIIFDGAKMTGALTEKGSTERERMTGAFRTAMDQLGSDEAVYKRERVYTVLGKIFLEQIDDSGSALSDELQNEITAMVAWADESTPDPYERQAIINAASNVLSRAGMADVAMPLLLAELDKSKEPYYFMLALADIEQEAGNYDEALQWLRKAYDASTGPATRFQWGYYYLAGLLEMTPEDTGLIQSATIEVIRELGPGSGFYQRPKAQLGRLEEKLLQWSEETEQADAINAIRVEVLAVCSNFAKQESSLETCQSFLDSA